MGNFVLQRSLSSYSKEFSVCTKFLTELEYELPYTEKERRESSVSIVPSQIEQNPVEARPLDVVVIVLL